MTLFIYLKASFLPINSVEKNCNFFSRENNLYFLFYNQKKADNLFMRLQVDAWWFKENTTLPLLVSAMKNRPVKVGQEGNVFWEEDSWAPGTWEEP